jgi:putative redox protein
MEIKAALKWVDKMQMVARSGKSPAVIMDNVENGSGPTPMQLVLMGVAGCSAMDVVSIMKKKRANMSGFEVNISGDRAEDHPKRFTSINMEFVFTGRDIKPKDAERAIELSITKYCSAVASLNADVTHTYRIEEED